jgi:hypothetical protein
MTRTVEPIAYNPHTFLLQLIPDCPEFRPTPFVDMLNIPFNVKDIYDPLRHVRQNATNIVILAAVYFGNTVFHSLAFSGSFVSSRRITLRSHKTSPPWAISFRSYMMLR